MSERSTTDPKLETIVDGPSKRELDLALFEKDLVPNVKFTVQARLRGGLAPKEQVVIVIDEVGEECGGGQSWSFKGYVRAGGFPRAEGYYSTRTNTGCLKRIPR